MWNAGEPNDRVNREEAVHIVHENSGWTNAAGALKAGLWNDQPVTYRYWVPCVHYPDEGSF